MSYERFVGLRYLMAKKRSSVVSIITLISITGVALGVTALIVVLSVMGGFKKDLKEKILATKAHIVVQTPGGELMPDALKVADLSMTVEGVIGASPYLESEVMVSSTAGLKGVVLRGIVPDRIGQVSDLPTHIQEGKLTYLADDGALSAEIRERRDKELNDFLEKIERQQREIDEDRERLGIDASPDASSEVPESFGEIVPNKMGEVDDTVLTIKPTFNGINTGKGNLVDLTKIDETSDDDPSQDKVYEVAVPLDEADDIPDLPGDDGMPSLFGGEDVDAGDDEGGMPPLPGQEDWEEEEEQRLPGMIIGRELAKSLQVELGDELNVVTPNGEIGPMGRMPKSRPFRVVGIFYSGMYEYDANFGYTRIEDVEDFVGVKGATGVELKTVSVDSALDLAEVVQEKLDPSMKRYEVLDWMELNRSLFYALKLEKIAMFVVLTFIILVASFSIVAMLIMIVIEKGREIAVLKSLGATDVGIMKTFILQGTVIGSVGAGIGLVLGLGICYLLETVGFPLNSEVYYISTLPVDMNWSEIVIVVLCAMGISVLATIYPSIQAARLKPVDGLRDE